MNSGFTDAAKSLHLRAIWTWLAIASLVMMIAWYGFLEPPFVTYVNEPFPITGGALHPGDQIPILTKRCSASDRIRTYPVIRRLVRIDGVDPPARLAVGGAEIEPGCSTVISRQNKIPDDTTPGMYFVEGYAEVPGTWRTVLLHWKTQPFQVLPSPSKGTQ